METILMNAILEALREGDWSKILGYALIFLVIWLEVRGMKKQLKVLNTTIKNSFAAGEKRFETIEKDVHQIRLDLDKFKPPKEGNNGHSGKTTFA